MRSGLHDAGRPDRRWPLETEEISRRQQRGANEESGSAGIGRILALLATYARRSNVTRPSIVRRIIRPCFPFTPITDANTNDVRHIYSRDDANISYASALTRASRGHALFRSGKPFTPRATGSRHCKRRFIRLAYGNLHANFSSSPNTLGQRL